VQALFVGGPAAKTLHVWRVGFLETFFVHKVQSSSFSLL
jgi:hypothetical protein